MKYLSTNYFTIILFGIFCINYVEIYGHADSYLTTSEKISKEGYPVQEHSVITEDGYILKIQRIPGNLRSQAVFLQHGLLSSSYDWVIAGKNKSLAFILADNGYDVWLGNARGSTHSRQHTFLSPSNPRFWNFSWHEMGKYDLPAVITYITYMKNDSLIYVGHSMGTTMSYVMAIERPEMSSKVKILYSFAPSAYFYHSKSPVRFFSGLEDTVEFLSQKLRYFELLPQDALSRFFAKNICGESWSEYNHCAQWMFFFLGRNPSQFNFTFSREIMTHDPAGTSIKTLKHYMQITSKGHFRYYDYKPIGNMLIYNSTKAPEYNISKIQIPVGIFWADHDYFSDPLDVKRLYKQLPKKALLYRVPDSMFTHVDYIWGMNAPEIVYSKLLSDMKNYL